MADITLRPAPVGAGADVPSHGLATPPDPITLRPDPVPVSIGELLAAAAKSGGDDHDTTTQTPEDSNR